MTPAITYPQHARQIMRLGGPLILSNLAQFALHITDSIMLGWYSISALAASTIAGTFFFLTFILGAGFSQAVTPLVASAAEEGDEVQVRRVTRMGLWLSTFYGLAFMLPFFWAEEILLAMGQTTTVASEAQLYLTIVALQMVPALIVMLLKSFLAALEHTAVILWATLGTALLNIPINYALIFGNWGAPEMGIRGAAVASLVVTVLTVLILAGYIARKTPQYTLMKNIWRSDWSVMMRVFRLGWPIGLTSLAEGGLFSASAVMMGWIGEVPLAAHGIALQITSLAFVVHVGFSQAATVRAGRALGRRDPGGLKRGGITVLVLSFAVSVLTMAVFLLLPAPLISVFLDPSHARRDDVIVLGVLFLALAALFQIVDSAQVIALGLLRGVQDTRVPMLMATVSYWIIGLPVSYVLAFTLGMGGAGLWLGLVLGLSVAALLLLWRFWRQSVPALERRFLRDALPAPAPG
ncbi:MAG: MATE family efflux transporter [Paracoccaceae bacterium]